MKKLTLLLTLAAALLVAPTGAFAKDKCDKRDSESQKQARLEADRRANGYYTPRYYSRDRDCDHGHDSRDYRDYRGNYDNRYSSSYRPYWSR